MVMERCRSGVYGLDELIQGGFPRGRTVLLAGACGTGKSIMAMQFIYRGIAEYNEPGVFVTFDEMPEKIREDMSNFGWSTKTYEDAGKMAIIDATSARAGTPSDEEHAIMPGQMEIERVLVEIMNTSRNIGAKRLVIDSIPAMAYKLDNPHELRKTILKMGYATARMGLTTILTTEIDEQNLNSGAVRFSKYDVEEYVSDGVILLNFIGGGGQGAIRTLYVRKMRGTKHELQIHPMQITDKGIEVKK